MLPLNSSRGRGAARCACRWFARPGSVEEEARATLRRIRKGLDLPLSGLGHAARRARDRRATRRVARRGRAGPEAVVPGAARRHRARGTARVRRPQVARRALHGAGDGHGLFVEARYRAVGVPSLRWSSPSSAMPGTTPCPSRRSRGARRRVRTDDVCAAAQFGLWTALRTRPYGRVASPAITPRSLFVTDRHLDRTHWTCASCWRAAVTSATGSRCCRS